ncbi:DNA primase [bacterium]|nr:DNA primase [bacterium]
MNISETKIDEIRLANEVVDVIGEYVTLKKTGKNYSGLCPFHNEKTPSFSVNSEKQIFHCFGCHVGGNVFNFIMRHEKIGFIDAVRFLAKRAGIELPKQNFDNKENSETEKLYKANTLACDFYASNLTTTENPAFHYIQKREVDTKFIKKFQLGYSLDSWDGFSRFSGINTETLEKAGLVIKRENGGFYDRFRGRLMFPIHSLSGRVVGFTARQLVDTKDAPKYVNTPETEIYNKRKVLYGFYFAKESIRREDKVYLVEGNMDFIRLFASGIENVVASSGTALTEDQIQLLGRFTKNIVIVYDGDSAGSKAAVRGAEILVAAGFDVKVIVLPEGEDPDSLVRKHGKDAFLMLDAKALGLVDFLIASFKNAGFFESEKKKFEATKYVLEVIAKVPELTTRNFYLGSVADKMQVSERDLRSDYQKILAGTHSLKNTETVVIQDLVFGTLQPPERNIAAAILLSNEVVKLVREADLEIIEDELSNKIIHQVLDDFEEFGDVNCERLMLKIHNQEVVSFISRVSNWELDEDSKPVQTVKDTLKRLQKKKLEAELIELAQKQKNTTDFNEVMDLQKKVMDLQSKLRSK